MINGLKIFTLLGLLVLLLTACPSSKNKTAPTISSFIATPSTIDEGDSSKLSWDVTGSDPITLTIDPGVGVVTGTEANVSPTTTTTYKLTASNSEGSVSQDVTVTVNPATVAPTISSFTATPSTIDEGNTSKLSWNVTGTPTPALSINQNVGTVTGNEKDVTPNATTIYTLTATNIAGSASEDVTVTVNSAAVAPTISSFTATPSTIDAGNSSKLSWSVTGTPTPALSINQGVGTVTGNEEDVTPNATTTYTLTATNGAGSASEDVTVTVNPLSATAPTINSFTATPSTINQGNTSKLSWDVTGTPAPTLTINKGVGTVTGNEKDVTPDVTTTYKLTATNSEGSVSEKVTVTVNPGGGGGTAPTINSFIATPATIVVGETTLLSWDVTGTEPITLKISLGVKDVTGLTERLVKPPSTRTYVLTATNSEGEVTKGVEVIVTPAP